MGRNDGRSHGQNPQTAPNVDRLKRPTRPCSEADFYDVVDRIYAAATEPEQWTPTLAQIGDLLGGCPSVLGLQKGGIGGEMLAAPRWDPDCLRTFQRDYTVPATNPTIAPMFSGPVPQVVSVLDLMSQPAFRKTPFYNNINVPQQLGSDAISMALVRNNDQVGVLGFAPPRSKNVFEPHDRDLLERLKPHLSRAMEIYLRLGDLEGLASVQRQLLDRLPYGVLFVDARGGAFELNREAERVIRLQDGLRLSGGRLRAQHRTADRRLQRLIGEAVETRCRRRETAGGGIGVPRPSLTRPFSVMVAPFAGPAPDAIRGRPAGVVIVGDPERMHVTPVQTLKQLYGLTDAEARLVKAILRGEGLTRAAETLGITRNTANTHQKRIFAKTGATRQAELVRLILQTAPEFET